MVNFNRLWWPHRVPHHHREAMTQEIVWQRNVAIAVLSCYLASRLLLGAALFPMRRTLTVLILNTIYALETCFGLYGFIHSSPYVILGFLSSWSASVFVFLFYFLVYSLAKKDWTLWLVHGVPMIITATCIGIITKSTISYWKWLRTCVTNEPSGAHPGPATIGRTPVPDVEAPSSTPVTQLPKDMELADPDEKDTCVVCMTYRSNCCLVPCGHMVCMGCGNTVFKQPQKRCPICRKSIRQLVQTFR